MNLRPSDFHGSKQGWANLLAKHSAKNTLVGNHRTAWVVIGAGFTGLACARKLAKQALSSEVILLEARQLAQSASGRNSGYAVAVSDFAGRFNHNRIANYQRVNRINEVGLSLLRDLVKTHGIECQWSETGFYRVAADKCALGRVDEFLTYLKALGIDHQPLNADDLKAQLGTAHYQAGIKIKDGALVQPAALIYGLANCLPKNISLNENTPVLTISPGKTIVVTTPDAQIETDNLVVATNYEAPKLGILRNRLLGSTLSASCTRVLTNEEYATLGSAASWGVLSLHTGGATVRLTTDRRISIRNTAEYSGGSLLSEQQLDQRKTIHRAAFDARFPALTHVPFETSWSCVEGISWNGTSLFGKSADNIYYAGGYNGSGLSRGTAFGTALADWASGGSSQLIDDCLSYPKGRWLPPRPLLDVGAWFTVRNRFRGVGRDR